MGSSPTPLIDVQAYADPDAVAIVTAHLELNETHHAVPFTSEDTVPHAGVLCAECAELLCFVTDTDSGLDSA